MWTKTKPSEPGWYWVRYSDYPEDKEVSYVDENMIVHMLVSDTYSSLDDMEGYEWQPVQPPIEE